ncbi:zinc finger C2HC domain-containing protein 1C [Anopheles ziemanni]|uniref:zinc finger C2HC domain-containing protein 1C n=1 Tax=Anopheles ziemanni TaxID=345580 RepID=UPI00265E387D|nr:zinc finger C2HC domain-containing protein 1C [Anopheles ziemanni]
MKLKSLDYGDIIESFTNRYENIVKKMRFQQRQQQERDQRKIDQIATRTTTTTTTAASVVTSSNGRTTTNSAASATVELSERLNATTLSSTLGAGKVRQMFDERRHRVAGIDKSYPLQPIQTKTTATGIATTTMTAAAAAATNGNYTVNGNNSASNGGLADGSLSRGVAKAGLNNKTRVPPISANSRPRLMQQQPPSQRGQNLRQQDSNVGLQGSRGSNSGETLQAEAEADDNDNFLELEKFPDTMSLEGDLVNSTNHIHSPNGNYVPAKTPRSNGSSRTLPNSSVQKATRKPSVTTTTATSAASTPRSTNGSAKSGTAPSRFVGPVKSNGPSRTVTQPSPVSSAGSVRKASANGGSMLSATSLANEPVPDGLTRCEICSRNFADDRIEKHRIICQKTKSKKRKVFDATKHRVQGTDAEKYVLRGKKTSVTAQARKPSTQLAPAVASAGQVAAGGGNKQSNWRKKHEEFIATIRAAKELKAHLAKGGKLSDLPPPPPSENPDYVQCPHCSRRFNQTAADRHIPKCATMLHNKPKPKPKAASTGRRY